MPSVSRFKITPACLTTKTTIHLALNMGYRAKKNHKISLTIFSQEKWCEVHPSSCTGPRQGNVPYFSAARSSQPPSCRSSKDHQTWHKTRSTMAGLSWLSQYFAPSIVTGWPTPIYQWMIWMVEKVENTMIIWMMTGKYWLVIYPPLWKMMDFVSWDDCSQYMEK